MQFIFIIILAKALYSAGDLEEIHFHENSI